jgi:TetR/AcrR family transcriptional repressor of nem operon
MELLTEHGFSGTGVDAVLKRAGIPKGSFYHHFRNKEEFGTAVLAAYDEYFCQKLDRWLLNEEFAPLTRIRLFVNDAIKGMIRHRFTRGCLVGNFGQELSILPTNYRAILNKIFDNWVSKIEQCLCLAQKEGAISSAANCQALAQFFWIGWEGAVMRSRMKKEAKPMQIFVSVYLDSIEQMAITATSEKNR